MINSGYSMHMYCDAHPHVPASYSGRGEAFGRTRREAHAEAKLQGARCLRMRNVMTYQKSPPRITGQGPLAQIRYGQIIVPLTELARSLGYALATHGSLLRDVDLVAIPWVPEAVPAPELARAFREWLEARFKFAQFGTNGHFPREYFENGCPGSKPHGRLGWAIHIGGVWVDLSVMPREEA